MLYEILEKEPLNVFWQIRGRSFMLSFLLFILGWDMPLLIFENLTGSRQLCFVVQLILAVQSWK